LLETTLSLRIVFILFSLLKLLLVNAQQNAEC